MAPSVSKTLFNLRSSIPWVVNILFLAFFTSTVTFLVYTGKSVNYMQNATDNGNTQNNIYNGSDSFYREISFQATVICLLTIITFCIVYHTLKDIV